MNDHEKAETLKKFYFNDTGGEFAEVGVQALETLLG